MKKSMNRGDRGLTLINVVITIGISSIMSAMILAQMNTQIRASKSTDIRIETTAIKRTVTERINCSMTQQSCTGNSFVSLRNQNNREIGDLPTSLSNSQCFYIPNKMLNVVAVSVFLPLSPTISELLRLKRPTPSDTRSETLKLRLLFQSV